MVIHNIQENKHFPVNDLVIIAEAAHAGILLLRAAAHRTQIIQFYGL